MKWRIKGTRGDLSFAESAVLIINKRLKDLLRTIRLYFKEDSPENLHQVRIALRRLRYTLEVFFSCFEKKYFIPFYKMIEDLQDATGEVRDLDVLKTNLSLHPHWGKKNLPDFMISIDNKKSEINESLKLNLLKFLHSKELKNFKNHLNRRK